MTFRPESQDGFDSVDAAAYEAGMAAAPANGLTESDLDAMFADGDKAEAESWRDYSNSGYPCVQCGTVCKEAFCCGECEANYNADNAEDDMPECDPIQFDDSDHEDNMTDAEADADTLRSCGWGTDEDYGYYGGEDC